MNKNQALIFFGIILAGLGISLYTLNIFGDRVEETEDGADGRDGEKTAAVETPEPAPAPAPEPETKPDPKPAPEPAPATPEPAPAEKVYRSDEALAGALVDLIRARDVEGFLELAGKEGVINPAIRPQVEGILRDEQWTPRADSPISALARTPELHRRWAIHLEKSGDGATTDLYVDLGETGDPSSWEVKKIALPLDFAEKTGLRPAAGAMKPGEPGSPTAPGAPGADSAAGTAAMAAGGAVEASDALTVAYAFSQAMIERNFELARKLTDHERVTDERVAALMIALEEGTFHLREDKPLIVTLARDNLTWVITRVDSEAASSEFGVQMGRAESAPDWKIHGLTFSKLISALADQAGAGGVAYAPIVADPRGGDSLVLYFEFDEDAVSVRSSRQLRIVADILRADPSRRIKINGHADALGTDQYNEGLSSRRAEAIREKLVEFGVGRDQVEITAFGEAMPRRPNFNPDGTDNPDNRSQNRRAEVYLDF